MDSSDKDLKKTCDIEQMAVIGKMHNMQWLKSNSQLSGHTKTFPNGKELINNLLKSKINEGTQESTEVVSTTISNSSELENNNHISNRNIHEGDGVIKKNILDSSLTIVDFCQKDIMETVWNKDVNVTNTLFPSSQSLVAQRLDNKQETKNMELAESIVTVQLQQFRLNEEEKTKPDESCNDPDNDWDAVHHKLPELPKSDTDVGDQVNQRQCHDNNNNNAKSKTQPTSEVKKGMQKTTTKISTKKINDQKIKKQAGSLKESCIIPKQGSKDKDDLLKSFIDKYGKVNGCNTQLIIGKGARTKEQQFFKQHFSTLNDSGSRNRSSMEGLDERTSSVTAKLKLPRNDSDKKSEIYDTKKCHKVQVTRTQSYNVQYNRNKPLMKSQQRHLRNTVKPEEESSIKHSPSYNNNVSVSNSNESLSKKKCENQQTAIKKPISDIHSNQSISGKSSKSFNTSECSMNERSLSKPSTSIPCKRNCQNLSNVKINSERNVKDDQGYTQKFKKDTTVYRRSSDYVELKHLNMKAKTSDHKKNITDNNSVKDYRLNRMCSIDAKTRSQHDGSRVTIYPHKTINGANNTNKTDTLNSTTVNNVQSGKSLNSCSNSTKDFTTINTSTHMPQESQTSQASCSATEVQFVKTEQEDISNNISNNKMSTSNSDTKLDKYSGDIQKIDIADHSATSYSDNSLQQNKTTTNTFFSEIQNVSSNGQQTRNHQSVQNKSYFGNNNAQYSNTSANIQNSERDLHPLNNVQQKVEQTSHVPPQIISSHNNCNPAISMANGISYQNMPAIYLNQYNTAQAVPRKTADTVVSQKALFASNSYPVENQNIMQCDASNILMHNSQTSVLPPSGYHNHPVTSQHNQWNVPLQDVFLYGNVMNPAHALNMQMQNSRHVCNTDFNNIQQASGYLGQPLVYVPPICMQSWNPLLQYPTPIYQNTPYTNCNTFPNQLLPPNSLPDSVNCPVPTSMQNNPYKHFQQMPQLENNPTYSVPMKLINYVGNMQGCKSNNTRMKDNSMDVQMRPSQYRAPVPNEYQNCSQDAQLMVPYSYAVTMDPMARNGPSNLHMQVNQKYAQAVATSVNYQRMPEACSPFQNNQDMNRKDDMLRNDSDCVPPMVSPRECMYYGVDYSRKTDNLQNSSVRSDMKHMAYVRSANTQHYHVPQLHKNATYHASPKELAPRVTMGRGERKVMEQ